MKSRLLSVIVLLSAMGLSAMAPQGRQVAMANTGKTLAEHRADCLAGNLATCMQASAHLMRQAAAYENAVAGLGSACVDPSYRPAECDQAAAMLPQYRQALTQIDEMLFKACAGGVAEGCSQGGEFSQPRKAIGGDARARAFLEAGCAIPDAGNCVRLGDFLSRGDEKRRDPAGERQAYGKACSLKGWSKPCLYYGVMLEKGTGGPVDEVRARATHRANCDPPGNAIESCFRLAFLMRDGKGGEADEAEAARLFQRACAHNRREYRTACDESDRIAGRSMLANPRPAPAP